MINLMNQETKKKYFQKLLFYIITRLKSKSNVREKRGDGVLISFSNSIRRRMWIKEEEKKKMKEKIDTYIWTFFYSCSSPHVYKTSS